MKSPVDPIIPELLQQMSTKNHLLQLKCASLEKEKKLLISKGSLHSPNVNDPAAVVFKIKGEATVYSPSLLKKAEDLLTIHAPRGSLKTLTETLKSDLKELLGLSESTSLPDDFIETIQKKIYYRLRRYSTKIGEKMTEIDLKTVSKTFDI